MLQSADLLSGELVTSLPPMRDGEETTPQSQAEDWLSVEKAIDPPIPTPDRENAELEVADEVSPVSHKIGQGFSRWTVLTFHQIANALFESLSAVQSSGEATPESSIKIGSKNSIIDPGLIAGSSKIDGHDDKDKPQEIAQVCHLSHSATMIPV